jgi:peptidoglycan-N-acetylglucosamine deacetylase
MPKRIIVILFGIILLLSGCSSFQEDEMKQAELIIANSGKSEQVYELKSIKDLNRKPPNEYVVDPDTWTLKSLNDSKNKYVLMTIDDAPDQYALNMAETLIRLEVPAIFFINGHFVDTENEKEVLKQLDKMGFPIGNHTETHTNLSTLSAEEQKGEILSLNKTIENVIGKKPFFFRAPFGVNTEISKKIIDDEGMLMMNWTYGYDWEPEYQEKEPLADIMVNTPYLRSGAILLLHDRKWTNEALEVIVVGLRAKGYTFIDPMQIKSHP